MSIQSVSIQSVSTQSVSTQFTCYDVVSLCYSSLVIRDGPSAASETIPLNASDASDKKPLLSRTDKLWIKYTFQANKNGIPDFQLNYTTYGKMPATLSGACCIMISLFKVSA